MEVYFLTQLKEMIDSPYFNKIGVLAILVIAIFVYLGIRKLIKKVTYIDLFQRSMHKGITVMNGQGKVYEKEQERELNLLLQRESFYKIKNVE